MEPDGDTTTAIAEPSAPTITEPAPAAPADEEYVGDSDMAKAFVAARAEQGSTESDEATASAPAKAVVQPEAAPEDHPADAPPTSPEAPSSAEQAAIQRLRDLMEQGRLNELDPRVKGLADDVITKAGQARLDAYLREAAEEDQYRGWFLELEEMRVNDHEAWAEMTATVDPKGQEAFRFYQMYRSAHPEITLENPGGPLISQKALDARVATEANKVAHNLASLYGQGFEKTVDAIAADVHLPKDVSDSLKAEFKFGGHPDSGDLSTFVAKLITTAGKHVAEAERVAIRTAEREAARLEAQTEFNLDSAPPRSMPAVSKAPGSQSNANQTLADVFLANKQKMGLGG